jgi:hypothetical protein
MKMTKKGKGETMTHYAHALDYVRRYDDAQEEKFKFTRAAMRAIARNKRFQLAVTVLESISIVDRIKDPKRFDRMSTLCQDTMTEFLCAKNPEQYAATR